MGVALGEVLYLSFEISFTFHCKGCYLVVIDKKNLSLKKKTSLFSIVLSEAPLISLKDPQEEVLMAKPANGVSDNSGNFKREHSFHGELGALDAHYSKS